LQNLAPIRLDAPHEGHGDGNGAPHLSQNLASLEFSESQLEQRIDSPESNRGEFPTNLRDRDP
jgi:hypothetical protein